MSDMVERVALAIWQAREERFPRFTQRREPDETDRQSGAWDLCIKEARAAIVAMREPTKAMSEIAVPEPTHLYVDRDEEYRRKMWAATMADRMAARSQWQRMIDAALASEGKL